MNETTVSGSIAPGPAVGLGTQRRVQEEDSDDGTKAPDAPKAKEFGLWKNSVLAGAEQRDKKKSKKVAESKSEERNEIDDSDDLTIDQLAALGKKLSKPVKNVSSLIKSIRHKDGYTEFSGIDKEILRNKKPNTRKHPTNEKPKVDERDYGSGQRQLNLAEENISEEQLLAKELARRLDLFMKGLDRELGKKSSDRGIQSKTEPSTGAMREDNIGDEQVISQEQIANAWTQNKDKVKMFIKAVPVAIVPAQYLSKLIPSKTLEKVKQLAGQVDSTSYSDEYEGKGMYIFQMKDGQPDIYIGGPNVLQKYVKFTGQIPTETKPRSKIPSITLLDQLGLDASKFPLYIKKVPTPFISAAVLSVEGKQIETSWGNQTVEKGAWITQEENGHTYCCNPDAQGLPIGYIPVQGQQDVAEMWGNPYDDDKVDAINAANPPKRSTSYTPSSTPAKHYTYDRKAVASNISGKDSAAYDRFTGRDKDVAEGKITLSTDPNWYGATVDNYQASGPVVNIPANQLVGFEPDDKMNQPKSKSNVEKIVAGIKQGAKLPPLLVRKYKNGYQVLDGHHRFWAYKLSGVKSIPCQIVPDEDIEEISKQDVAEEGKGLWANIHAKQNRIKNGSGEHMRKPGSKGAPTKANFKSASKTESVKETTGDPKFDKMLKDITGKKVVAKQQKADTKKQARDAFSSMFGGGNPADTLSIRKKDVAEGLDEAVGGNYLYHATGSNINDLKNIISNGLITNASNQERTGSKLRALSFTRNWRYALTTKDDDNQETTGIANGVIFVVDQSILKQKNKMQSVDRPADIINEFKAVLAALPTAESVMDLFQLIDGSVTPAQLAALSQIAGSSTPIINGRQFISAIAKPYLADKTNQQALANAQSKIKQAISYFVKTSAGKSIASAGGSTASEYEEVILTPLNYVPFKDLGVVGYMINPEVDSANQQAIRNFFAKVGVNEMPIPNSTRPGKGVAEGLESDKKILRLFTFGKSPEQIADELNIDIDTVTDYIKNRMPQSQDNRSRGYSSGRNVSQGMNEQGVTEDAASVKYGVFSKGGSVGDQKWKNDPIKTFDNKEEAIAFAKHRRAGLSKGEKAYYRMSYVVKPIKNTTEKQVNEHGDPWEDPDYEPYGSGKETRSSEQIAKDRAEHAILSKKLGLSNKRDKDSMIGDMTKMLNHFMGQHSKKKGVDEAVEDHTKIKVDRISSKYPGTNILTGSSSVRVGRKGKTAIGTFPTFEIDGHRYITLADGNKIERALKQDVDEGSMYGDEEVSWEKGGRRAPTGAFRNPAAEGMPVNKHIAKELDTLLTICQDMVEDIKNRSRSGYGNNTSEWIEDAIFEISGLSNGFHSSTKEGIQALQELMSELPRIGKWIMRNLKKVGNRIDLPVMIKQETSKKSGATSNEFTGTLDSKDRFTKDTVKNMFGKLSPDAKDVNEAKIVGLVGDIAGLGNLVQCHKCGTNLRDDHGFALDDNSYVCRDGQKCSMRQSKNNLSKKSEKGEKPRWRRNEDVNEATGYKSQFPSAAPAIQYAKDKVKTFRDPDDGIEIWSMPDGGCDVVHTSNSNGRYHCIDNRGKKLGTIRPQKQGNK